MNWNLLGDERWPIALLWLAIGAVMLLDGMFKILRHQHSGLRPITGVTQLEKAYSGGASIAAGIFFGVGIPEGFYFFVLLFVVCFLSYLWNLFLWTWAAVKAKDISKLIQTQGESAELLNNLGCAYRECGELEDARAALERAIRLKPTLALAYVNLGNVHVDRSDYEKAMDMYHKAKQIEPENANIDGNIKITEQLIRKRS